MEKSRPRSFRRSRDYPELVSGAHRKPATPIGVPCLVAQFAFWQPLNETGSHQHREGTSSDKGGNPKSQFEWHNAVDEYLRLIYSLNKNNNFDSPNTETGSISGAEYVFLFKRAIDLRSTSLDLKIPAEVKSSRRVDRHFEERNHTIVFTFDWNLLAVTIRTERHQEYTTLNVFIDLSIAPGRERPNTLDWADNSQSRNELTGNKVYDEVVANIEKLNSELGAYSLAREAAERQKEPLEAKAWRARFTCIHNHLYKTIWEKFSEDVLLSTANMTSDGRVESITANDRSQGLGRVFADFRAIVISELHPDLRPQSPSNSEGLEFQIQAPGWHIADNARGWMGSKLNEVLARSITQTLWPFITSEPSVPLRRKEFTASRMLGGRAIYISALGAQPSSYLGEESEESASNADFTPVYYLLYMTTFSRWQIGRLIDRIHHQGTVRIAALERLRALNVVNQKLRDMSVPKYAENIRDVQQEIASWDKEFYGGGLHYRIERSRYYVKQFMDGLHQLRIRRVEGYQPYHLFVLRRLESTFDFIDRIGIRLDRFRNRLEVSAQAASANTLVELQNTADIALFTFLIPYYVNGNLDHILDRILDGSDRERYRWYVVGLYVSVWVVSIAVGMKKVFDRRRKVKLDYSVRRRNNPARFED